MPSEQRAQIKRNIERIEQLKQTLEAENELRRREYKEKEKKVLALEEKRL